MNAPLANTQCSHRWLQLKVHCEGPPQRFRDLHEYVCANHKPDTFSSPHLRRLELKRKFNVRGLFTILKTRPTDTHQAFTAHEPRQLSDSTRTPSLGVVPTTADVISDQQTR